MLGSDALGIQALGGSDGDDISHLGLLGMAVETDTALQLNAGRTLAIGIATETDSALFVLPNLGLPVETDSALSIRPLRTHVIGIATETDTALSITLLFGQSVPSGIATETDSALSVFMRRLGIATETDTALTILPLLTGNWPFDDLKPRHIGIHPCASPIGGGVSLTGREPVIDSGAGYWRIVYGGVSVNTRAQVFLMRAMEARFEGRGRSILIPIYDGKRAPWVTVDGAITATASAAVAAGATAIAILATTAGTLKVGQHFSVGHCLYRIKTITGPVANVYTCTIWPKTREAIALGASLEFRRPKLRARLADDGGLSMQLRLLRFGDVNVEFVEDVP